MKHISKYCLTIVLSSFFACNSITNGKVSETSDDFRFPVVIDTLHLAKHGLPMVYNPEYWWPVANYDFHYIGPYKDTIILDHFLYYIPPPPPPSECCPEKEISFESLYDLEAYCIPWDAEKHFEYWFKADVKIDIDLNPTINNRLPVLLTNLDSDTIIIGYGEIVPLIMEAKDSLGNWGPMEERFIYKCGVGISSVFLPPQEVVLTSAPIFDGEFETTMRLRLGKNYSKEFKGNVNYNKINYCLEEHRY